MLIELASNRRHVAKQLFHGFDWHLAIDATLAGSVSGIALVDDLQRPTAALVGANHRYFLVGRPDHGPFLRAVADYFKQEIVADARMTDASAFTLTYKPSGWKQTIESAFADLYPLPDTRLYLECSRPILDWRSLVPAPYSVVPVTAELLHRPGLKNVTNLMAEMQSERASIEEFLSASFGFCMIYGDEIIGWCLSEYNHNDRCEVGIETVEAYRLQGIATILASALLEHAVEHGIRRVGWHCWARNEASIATARKAGFREVDSYSLYFAWFDRAINFAVNGNVRLWDGRPLEALEWYQRALASGDVPAWAWWNAASSAARLCYADLALAYLDQAARRGFPNPQRVTDSDDWASLRRSPRWPEVLRIAGIG